MIYGVARETVSERARAGPTESEEILRLAMDNAAIGMCLVSPDGHFLRVNAALCRFFARSEQELLSLSWQEVTHPDDVDTSARLLGALLAGDDESFRTTKRYVRPDGSVVWGDVSVSRLRAPDLHGGTDRCAVRGGAALPALRRVP